MLFVDASALVKRYVEEVGSAFVIEATTEQPVAISRLSIVELCSAICRRWRDGDLLVDQRDGVLLSLENEQSAFHLVEITEDVTVRARALLLRHPLRASDSLQLASCLLLADQLRAPTPLLAFDDRLLTAAAAEGVQCVAPAHGREPSCSRQG